MNSVQVRAKLQWTHTWKEKVVLSSHSDPCTSFTDPLTARHAPKRVLCRSLLAHIAEPTIYFDTFSLLVATSKCRGCGHFLLFPSRSSSCALQGLLVGTAALCLPRFSRHFHNWNSLRWRRQCPHRYEKCSLFLYLDYHDWKRLFRQDLFRCHPYSAMIAQKSWSWNTLLSSGHIPAPANMLTALSILANLQQALLNIAAAWNCVTQRPGLECNHFTTSSM